MNRRVCVLAEWAHGENERVLIIKKIKLPPPPRPPSMQGVAAPPPLAPKICELDQRPGAVVQQRVLQLDVPAGHALHGIRERAGGGGRIQKSQPSAGEHAPGGQGRGA